MADLSTYSDVIDLVRGLIADSSANSRLATNDQIDIWANSSLAEMTEHAEHIDAVQTVTPMNSGVSKVTLSGGVLGVWRVEIEDEFIDPTTTAILNRSSRKWEQKTGQPRWYYLDSLMVSTTDNYTFGLWPKTSGSYDLRVIYTILPDELTYADRTDKVMLPLWAVPGLVWGILTKFYASESRMQSMKASKFYEIMYNDMVSRLRARSFSRMPGYKAYGEGQSRTTKGSFWELLPSDFVTYP